MSRLASIATCVVGLALCATIAAFADPDEAAPRGRRLGLADVRSVYVADFGSSDVYESARATLMAELKSVGFTVSEEAAGADAIFGGTIVSKRKGGEVVVMFRRAYLRAPSGEPLWNVKLWAGWRFRKFGPGGDDSESTEDEAPSGSVQRQARNVPH